MSAICSWEPTVPVTSGSGGATPSSSPGWLLVCFFLAFRVLLTLSSRLCPGQGRGLVSAYSPSMVSTGPPPQATEEAACSKACPPPSAKPGLCPARLGQATAGEGRHCLASLTGRLPTCLLGCSP